MGERLSRFGVGPKIVVSVVACAAVAGTVTYPFPEACILDALHTTGVVTLAVVLLALGVPMWEIGVVEAMRAYNRDQLVTSGVFALVRHPV